MKWYALFVTTGKEEEVKKCIQRDFGNISCKCYVPKRIVPEKRKGQFSHIVKMIFPGYVFIHAEMNFSVYYNIMKLPNIRSFLNYSNTKDIQYDQPYKDEEIFFQNIPDEEMRELQPFINYESDIMNYSIFGFKNKKVIIVSGPLVGLEGRVQKIDKRKRRAKLSIKFMGREKLIDVGFEIICPTGNVLMDKKRTLLECREKVEFTIREVLQFPEGRKIDNILVNNGLNSLSFIQVILKLESELGLEISEDCLSLEKWSSIDKIVYDLQREYKKKHKLNDSAING